MDLRDLLIKNVESMFPTATFFLDFQQLVDSIRPGTFITTAPISPGTTTRHVVNVIVDRALLEGWIKPIFDRIPRKPANAAELDLIAAQLAGILPTTHNPFDEVLLEGDRPFANRQDLRFSLRTLCAAGGSTLLMIDGEPKTGKSFSFYLAQHIARQQGFITSQFDVSALVDHVKVAGAVLGRIGVPLKDEGTGLESRQRSGNDLADQVREAMEERKQKRLLVFDGFPLSTEVPLPPETISFVIRLAKYADEELRPYLRVLLIKFTEQDKLPANIDDIAEHDEAQGFTDTDMLTVLKQIAQARGWSVSDQALQQEIAIVATKPLRERFQFMRKTIRKLARAAASGTPAPGGPPGAGGGPP